MTWAKIKIAGATYDLSHLDPFSIDVTPKMAGAPTYKVQVSFGCHTFTRDPLATDTPDYRFKHKGETRCFCPTRHGLSSALPGIIMGGIRKVYFTQEGTYFIARRLPALAQPYFIPFAVERGKACDVAMFVITAYEKTDMPKRASAVTMATLIAKTAAGLYVTAPPAKPVTW